LAVTIGIGVGHKGWKTGNGNFLGYDIEASETISWVYGYNGFFFSSHLSLSVSLFSLSLCLSFLFLLLLLDKQNTKNSSIISTNSKLGVSTSTI
jgi:hypothetical protein